MIIRILNIVVILWCSILIFYPCHVFAEDKIPIDKDSAVALVKTIKQGDRIIKAISKNDLGYPIYEVRVLTKSGRVETILIDACSGNITAR